MSNENGRTIFHVQGLVKDFCKILCNGDQECRWVIPAKLDDGVPVTNGPPLPFHPAWGELVFLTSGQVSGSLVMTRTAKTFHILILEIQGNQRASSRIFEEPAFKSRASPEGSTTIDTLKVRLYKVPGNHEISALASPIESHIWSQSRIRLR